LKAAPSLGSSACRTASSPRAGRCSR
jgi:hypothetical protein